MLLTISTTHEPATDLGFLLHKNPENVRTLAFPFGAAHVFYPEASDERCTAAVLLEIDAVGLVRSRKGSHGDGATLAQYVNDRPYVASSFMSVVLAKLFGTAMGGRSKERPDLADATLPLEVHLPVLPCRGGEAVLRRIFEPLGYEVAAAAIPLDECFEEWGSSRYLDVTFTITARLADVLSHLYVLLPVLDDDKHYWVSEDEIEKLLKRGGDWLVRHPDKELITRRYLRYRGQLMESALARLMEEDPTDPDAQAEADDREEEAVEEKISLNTQRLGAVTAVLKAAGARTVVDVGCGEGRLLQALLREPEFRKVAGADVSHRALAVAGRRLRLSGMSERQRERVELFQTALTYRDRRLAGFDAVTAIEVIEHIDPERLPGFERSLFQIARPPTVVVTTPNAEYNVRFEFLPEGSRRHRDHRFEWTRAEFREWANGVAGRHGYAVRFLPIGPDDPDVGPPTQMAVFSR